MMNDATDEPLISQAEAARRLGVNRSTISRQIQDGALRAYGTKVRFSEVVADRDTNIDRTRSNRRNGAPKKSAANCAGATRGVQPSDSHRLRGSKTDNQTRKAAADAEMRELDLAHRRAKLTTTSEVSQAAGDAIALMQSAFERAVDDAASAAAARHNWDERKIRVEMKALARLGLDVFNRELLKRLDQRKREELAGTARVDSEYRALQ